MKRWLIAVGLCTASILFFGNDGFANAKETIMDRSPRYLYKILSLRNWQASQNRKTVQLSADDELFVHFSMENQLERIIGKHWANTPQFVILKIDSSKLKGTLTFETNPGGITKY